MSADATTGLYPRRRSVGGRLQLTFKYSGDAELGVGGDSAALNCEIEATWHDMWVSTGSVAVYDTTRSLATEDVTIECVGPSAAPSMRGVCCYK